MEVDVPAGLVRTCDLRAVTPSYAMDVEEEEKKREDVKCGNLLVISSSIPLPSPPPLLYVRNVGPRNVAADAPNGNRPKKGFMELSKLKIRCQMIPSLSLLNYFR